jgi:pantoate--beta-alanine ligase
MRIATTIAAAREHLAACARPVGFVPTMGALHAGHIALLAAARAACASVVASLFVNPMQFAPNEDFSRYPRDAQGDREQFERAGVDVLFAPDANEMYPPDFSTYVEVGSIGASFEGALRPAHFRGVATVVAKLLNVIAPDVLYLGQKDAQQTAVLRKLVADLAFNVRVEIVPTVREGDGVALSSRNQYLNERERSEAPSLHRALQTVESALRSGAAKETALERGASALSPLAVLDYLDVVDADTFAPSDGLKAPAYIIGAARFGTTRLIDNLRVER